MLLYTQDIPSTNLQSSIFIVKFYMCLPEILLRCWTANYATPSVCLVQTARWVFVSQTHFSAPKADRESR